MSGRKKNFSIISFFLLQVFVYLERNTLFKKRLTVLDVLLKIIFETKDVSFYVWHLKRK